MKSDTLYFFDFIILNFWYPITKDWERIINMWKRSHFWFKNMDNCSQFSECRIWYTTGIFFQGNHSKYSGWTIVWVNKTTAGIRRNPYGNGCKILGQPRTDQSQPEGEGTALVGIRILRILLSFCYIFNIKFNLLNHSSLKNHFKH